MIRVAYSLPLCLLPTKAFERPEAEPPMTGKHSSTTLQKTNQQIEWSHAFNTPQLENKKPVGMDQAPSVFLSFGDGTQVKREHRRQSDKAWESQGLLLILFNMLLLQVLNVGLFRVQERTLQLGF